MKFCSICCVSSHITSIEAALWLCTLRGRREVYERALIRAWATAEALDLLRWLDASVSAPDRRVQKEILSIGVIFPRFKCHPISRCVHPSTECTRRGKSHTKQIQLSQDHFLSSALNGRRSSAALGQTERIATLNELHQNVQWGSFHVRQRCSQFNTLKLRNSIRRFSCSSEAIRRR